MTIPAFIPYPGFDPFDGLDSRITLSPDNPCRVAADADALADQQQRNADRGTEGLGVGGENFIDHTKGDAR